MYDYETSNQSFINLNNRLKDMGIANNKQFLLLNNKDLVGVNPWDKNLSETKKGEIIQECENNIWYFLREVIRIPEDIFDNTKLSSKFYINLGVFVMIFLWTGGFNQFTCMPTAMFKTGTVCALYSYLKNIFGLSLLNISINSTSDTNVNSIKSKIKKYQIPDYLKSGSDKGNLEKHVLVDNFTRVTNNFFEWQRIKDKDNVILLSTAGDLKTESGRFAFQLKNNSIQWQTEYLDAKKKYLDELYKASSDKLFYVQYNTNDLLADVDKLCQRAEISLLCEDPDIIDREVNLMWK